MYQVLGIHGFAFPLLLTSCHMGFSFVILLPFMLCKPYVSRHKPTLEQQWKGLVAIGEAGFLLACLRCMAACCWGSGLCCALQVCFWPPTSPSTTSVWCLSPCLSTRS